MAKLNLAIPGFHLVPVSLSLSLPLPLPLPRAPLVGEGVRSRSRGGCKVIVLAFLFKKEGEGSTVGFEPANSRNSNANPYPPYWLGSYCINPFALIDVYTRPKQVKKSYKKNYRSYKLSEHTMYQWMRKAFWRPLQSSTCSVTRNHAPLN